MRVPPHERERLRRPADDIHMLSSPVGSHTYGVASLLDTGDASSSSSSSSSDTPVRLAHESLLLLRGGNHHRPPSIPAAHEMGRPAVVQFVDVEPVIAYNCLLVPMVVVAWWYWTKKKARQVYLKLIRAEAEDDSQSGQVSSYTSWEEVRVNSVSEPSLHFVRWIRGKNSSRRRVSVQLSTIRTMRLASKMSDLSEPLDDDDDDDNGIYVEPQSKKERETRPSWQCIRNMETDDLCSSTAKALVEEPAKDSAFA